MIKVILLEGIIQTVILSYSSVIFHSVEHCVVRGNVVGENVGLRVHATDAALIETCGCLNFNQVSSTAASPSLTPCAVDKYVVPCLPKKDRQGPHCMKGPFVMVTYVQPKLLCLHLIAERLSDCAGRTLWKL